MKTYLSNRIGRALGAAIVFGTVAFVLPSVAMADDAATPAAAPAAAKAMASHGPIEARIRALHRSLEITAAQEPQWQAVAQAMRDNAKTMKGLIDERVAKGGTMTAVDDLHSYEAIAEAHAAGIKALIPSFEALYASMSDVQKKNADAIFRHRPKHHRHAAAKKSG